MYAVVRTGGTQVRMSPGGAVRVEKLGGSVGDRGVGGEDPTLPPMPAVNPRAGTEPPPMDAAGDADKTVEQKVRAKELDGVATEDTGPLPRVEGDKVG